MENKKGMWTPTSQGNRTYYVYHPRAKECIGQPYSTILAMFKQKLETFYQVALLYQEEMPQSPKVVTDEVKREIKGLLIEISKHQNSYELEALAQCLWDQDPNQKCLPYYYEIKAKAISIRASDSGIVLAGMSNKKLVTDTDEKRVKNMMVRLGAK